MKKLRILPIVILLSLMLIMPTIAQPAANPIWVMMHGRVEYFGLNPAWGHCGVYAKVGEWAQVFAAWMLAKPGITTIFNFYAARLMNTTIVELNYSSSDLYIDGLWNVYNVTFIYEPGQMPGNYTFTIELLVDHGEGTLTVSGNWTTFTISITGIDEVGGSVKRYIIRPLEPIPIGDICGPNKGPPDNNVNIFDLVHVAKAYGTTPGMPGMEFDFSSYFSMDFNFDFKIDIIDLTTIAVNIGESY
ncbi:MAG: hypothetical protein ACPLYF_02235 [Fervidobacterium sp.]